MARRAILGLGCDPVRAEFARKAWEPVLGVDVETATDFETLWARLATKRYELFFIAPGMCQLAARGIVDGGAIKARVLAAQPHIKIVEIGDVSKALPLLSSALGGPSIEGAKPRTEDWPFVD